LRGKVNEADTFHQFETTPTFLITGINCVRRNLSLTYLFGQFDRKLFDLPWMLLILILFYYKKKKITPLSQLFRFFFFRGCVNGKSTQLTVSSGQRGQLRVKTLTPKRLN